MASSAELIGRLIELAGTEHELLLQEQWERAIEVRHDYDENFTLLSMLVQREPLVPAQAASLEDLYKIHLANVATATALRDKAGSALGELTRASKITAYAPLGATPERVPRYLDKSA